MTTTMNPPTTDVLPGSGSPNSSLQGKNLTMNDPEYWEILQSLNDAKAEALIPAMVVLGILMAMGIVGNSLVCYIFGFRMKSGTQNFLIIWLAIFDLLSCTICIPNQMADLRYYYTFDSQVACKITRFANTFTSIGSIFTLIVIAVDRFRKICKPFKKQMHMRHAKLAMLPVVGLALFFAWPAVIIYGLRKVETGVDGITGTDCSTSDSVKDTIYPIIYNGILFLCFIVLTISLTTIYYFVLKETRRHNKNMKRNSMDYHGNHQLPHSHVTTDDSLASTDTMPLPVAYVYSNNSASKWVVNEAFAPDADDNPAFSKTNEKISDKNEGNHQAQPSGNVINNSETHETVSPSDGDSEELKKSDEISTVSFQTPAALCDVTLIETLPTEANNSVLSDSNPSSNNVTTAASASGGDTNDTNHQEKERKPPTHECDRKSKKGSHVDISESALTKSRSESCGSLHNIRALYTQDKMRMKRRQRAKSKTTIIAFLVTLVFILSFLPHLCLQVTKILVDGFDYRMEGAPLVFYNIFLRSYFINSVSNPIIYGLLNAHFSKEVRTLFRRLFRLRK